MQITVGVVLSVFATVVTGSVAAFAWRRPEMPGALPVAAFTAASSVWTAGNALQVASTTLSGKLFWVDVQYVGLVFVPLAWVAFACEYTGRERWANRRALGAFAVPLVGLVALAWTNEYHHLVRASSGLATVGGVVVVRRTFGPVFWMGWAYSNLLSGLGTVVLFHGLVRSRGLYRRQTLAVLGGTTVPWLASGLFYNGLTTIEPEVFFAVSGLAYAYAIAEYDLLDAVPVGRTTVFEEMDDPVLVLDGDDRIVDANPASRELFGGDDADALLGRPIGEVCAEQPELVERDETTDADVEVVVEDGDGERRHFDVQSSSLSDAPTSGTALLLRDVTRRKRHERHLERQNERLERVGHTIAHDLRNPLNVAQGNLELAREVADDGDSERLGDDSVAERDDADRLDAPVAERLAEVESAHERMDDIIDEVLAVAKGEQSGSRDYLAPRQVAESAWRNVETRNADLAFDGADVPVVADEGQLTSAFENLFRNSVEHGGDDVTVRVGSLDDEAGFYVEDDGTGLPGDERDAVFERGFTTSADGTGVGLAVVEDVAERHGWEVGATESESGGARFEVRGVETPLTPVR